MINQPPSNNSCSIIQFNDDSLATSFAQSLLCENGIDDGNNNFEIIDIIENQFVERNNDQNLDSNQDLSCSKNEDLTFEFDLDLISFEQEKNGSVKNERKRGRKKKETHGQESSGLKSRLSSKQRKIEQIKMIGGVPICFGNKVIDKNSAQYKIERKKNNENVSKIRKKLDEKIQNLEFEIIKRDAIIDALHKKINGLQFNLNC